MNRTETERLVPRDDSCFRVIGWLGDEYSSQPRFGNQSVFLTSPSVKHTLHPCDGFRQYLFDSIGYIKYTLPLVCLHIFSFVVVAPRQVAPPPSPQMSRRAVTPN